MSAIIVALSLSLFINVLIHKIKMPTIIGYIVTGTIIGYTFDFSGENAHLLSEIAEFGIVFLMFTIGLEFSVEKLKLLKYDVFVVGTLQILVTGLITFFVVKEFGLGINEAFVISMIIPLSSTAIVLKIFNDSGDINKRFGQKVVGILIMQDIAVIPILIILGLMISTDKDITQVLMNTFVSGFILLFVMFLFGKFLLEPFFDTTIQTNSEELFMLTVLFLVIGASYLSHMLGFSYSLGAFIAGMLISETKYKYKTESGLTSFRDLLLGIFFITVGMQINLEIIKAHINDKDLKLLLEKAKLTPKEEIEVAKLIYSQNPEKELKLVENLPFAKAYLAIKYSHFDLAKEIIEKHNIKIFEYYINLKKKVDIDEYLESIQNFK